MCKKIGVCGLAAAAFVLLALAGCKEEGEKPPTTEAEISELVAGNNAFAIGLYHAVRGDCDNIICSPYSVSVALAMTYAGARNETETQMAQTLHFTLPQDRLHPAFKALQLDLATRGSGSGGGEGDGFTLKTANSLWGQTGYSFLPEFLDVLAVNYDAGMRLVDFVNAPESARADINQWVDDATEGRIQDIATPDIINELTRLVLANAIYFKARWDVPFGEEWTVDGTFHLLEGGEVTAQMMRQEHGYEFVQGDGYAAVDLPYDGGEASMVVFLPDAGRFEEFENALDAELVEGTLAALAEEDLWLVVPRFSFESAFSLRDALTGMGMVDAFSSSAADFSGMSREEQILLEGVLHKGTISVDERGTEASGVTLVYAYAGMPLPFVANRPFIFLIRDVPTGAILFLGRVVDPTL